MRHGQAISNYLSEVLGPDEWFRVEGTCQYDNKQGMVYNIFDAGASPWGLVRSCAVGLCVLLRTGVAQRDTRACAAAAPCCHSFPCSRWAGARH